MKLRIFGQSGETGFTMVEVIISMMIVALLGSIFFVSMHGLRSRDNVDRAAQEIQNDLIYMRSRAISTNATHRINFTSTLAWNLEYFDDSSWKLIGESRNMPQDTYLTEWSFGNAKNNLEATSRGLYVFQNSAVGNPFVQVTGLGAGRTKVIEVGVGGAISISSE